MSLLACGNQVRDPGEQCDDGNSNPLDHCIGCQKAYCGDGHLEAGEDECEVNVGGYSRETCVGCKRKLWRPCRGDGECPANAACLLGTCAPALCAGSNRCAGNTTGVMGGSGLCPSLPDFQFRAIQNHCVIACREGNVCPPGLVCIDGTNCGVLR